MHGTARKTDVMIVGGGPIGLAAAIAASMAGFRVTVADRKRPPIDKACGEGIMPDGVELFESLGVDLRAAGAVPFIGLDFIEGDVRASGRFPGRPGLGLPRAALHDALVRRAERLGIEQLWGQSVLGLHARGVDLQTGAIEARWVLGADGAHSRLRRMLGLDVPSVYQRFGVRRHYQIGPWSDRVEVYWSNRCEAYVTPVGRELVCLAILIHDPSLRFDQGLALFPDLERRLAAARSRSESMTGGTVYRKTPRVVDGSIALLGDAAGSVDAITGAGITLGLHQAVLLARALRSGILEEYDAGYRRLMRLANGMTSFMLAIHARPRLRGWTLRTLAVAPWIFSQLLSLHTRAFPFTDPGGGPRASRSGAT
jgi:flavin-dependent dehydrogenase